MVAAARLAIDAGFEVRGSDNPLYPPTADIVTQLGIPVASQYAAENLDWNPDAVILGNVLSRGNPEVEAALQRRLPYVSLPEWLKQNILQQRRPVVICGTHGKTTTTALTAHVLAAADLQPGYLIGGQPLDLTHPAHLGQENAPFVIEGDEYDTAFFDKRAKFLHYQPEIAVVTSLEFDHGDIYRDLEEIETAFQRMLRQIPATGSLITCADNHAQSLKPHAFSQVTTYGFADHADWRIEITTQKNGRTHANVHHQKTTWGEFSTHLVGKHNLQNALAALVVAATLGVPQKTIADALHSFKGVRRRMEIFLETNGITFVDDFAHHPTAIRETILAAKMRWPQARIRVLFEPRSNTTATNRFQQELTEAFHHAHQVYLGPIYRPERIPENKRLDRESMADNLTKKGVPTHAITTIPEIVEHVLAHAQQNDVVLIISNGAFGGIYDAFEKACTPTT